jgi:hypothetical protein
MSTVLRDPIDGKFTNYAKFMRREAKRAATYAALCEALPVDVAVKMTKPVCQWSITDDKTTTAYQNYARRDRQQRAVNWPQV